MAEEQKKEEAQTENGLTDDQKKVAEQRATDGVCLVCGKPRWFCGGEYSHKRKKDLGKE